MGLISRHPGAPYTAGEILQGGPDLEVDIGNLYNEFNGNITGANFSATAAIGADKIADGTVTGVKLRNAALTTALMLDAADVSTDATADALTTSATLVDVPSLSPITITPNSIDDIIMIEFMASYVASGSTGFLAQYGWTMSIGGVDLGLLAVSGRNLKTLDSSSEYISLTLHWAQKATSTSATVIQPRYRELAGSVATTSTFTTTISGTAAVMQANKHLTVQLFPG